MQKLVLSLCGCECARAGEMNCFNIVDHFICNLCMEAIFMLNLPAKSLTQAEAEAQAHDKQINLQIYTNIKRIANSQLIGKNVK